MTKSTASTCRAILRSPFFTFGLTTAGVLLCCLGCILLAGYYSKLALAHLQQGQFSQARKYAQASYSIVTVANTATLKTVPDLVVWQEALSITSQTDTVLEKVVHLADESLAGTAATSVESLAPDLLQLQQSLEHINTTLPRTFFIKKQLSTKTTQQLQFASQALSDLHTVISHLSEGKQTWVVLLQNSDEIRATGGFPGSYILLQFDTGVLTEILVEDIYDADGQFQGYIAAPPGIREYTSSDRGLRLPDANWWPDFPTSAQTLLQFFALGDKNNIAGVIAVNLDTAKSILAVTGPLWLPDYDVTVTQENIGEVLRSERSEFFPGSSQKKHLLQLSITQLKQKLLALSPDQQAELAEVLLAKTQEKELQLFSTRPELQELFSTYLVSGELDPSTVRTTEVLDRCGCQPLQLALVESNVGINKVNKYVTRESSIVVEDDSLLVTTEFRNNAAPLSSTELTKVLDQPLETQPRNSNGYLNYYRVLVSPSYTVTGVSINDTAVTSWDEEVITTVSGQQLRQVGVLIGTPEKSGSTVTFKLHTPSTPQALLLYKQSGIPASKYRVTTATKHQEAVVNSNMLFEL